MCAEKKSVYLIATLSRERGSNAYIRASLIKTLDVSISILLFGNFQLIHENRLILGIFPKTMIILTLQAR